MIPGTPRLHGLLCALAAPLCWSIGGPVMRAVDAGGWETTFWRSLSLVVILAPALLVLRGKAPFRELAAARWSGWTSALMLSGVLVLHVLAIANTTVANVLVLQSTTPVFVIVMAALLLGERVDRRTGALLALSFAGLIPVIIGSAGSASSGRASVDGDIMALGVAVFSTINILIIRRQRVFNLVAATVVAGAFASSLALIGGSPFGLAGEDMAALFALGVVQNVLGVTFFYAALRLLPVAEVTLIALLEPILGPLWAWLAVGEAPPLLTLAGGALILTAVILKAAGEFRRSEVSDAAALT